MQAVTFGPWCESHMHVVQPGSNMAKTNVTIDGPRYSWKVGARLACVTRPALALLGALKYQWHVRACTDSVRASP